MDVMFGERGLGVDLFAILQFASYWLTNGMADLFFFFLRIYLLSSLLKIETDGLCSIACDIPFRI